jgi:hypothetical protein
MADLLSRSSRTWAKCANRVAELVDRIGFRLRLLRLAFQPIANVPAAVIMSLEAPIYRLPWRDQEPEEKTYASDASEA